VCYSAHYSWGLRPRGFFCSAGALRAPSADLAALAHCVGADAATKCMRVSPVLERWRASSEPA
jgi:hypothetical protein